MGGCSREAGPACGHPSVSMGTGSRTSGDAMPWDAQALYARGCRNIHMAPPLLSCSQASPESAPEGPHTSQHCHTGDQISAGVSEGTSRIQTPAPVQIRNPGSWGPSLLPQSRRRRDVEQERVPRSPTSVSPHLPVSRELWSWGLGTELELCAQPRCPVRWQKQLCSVFRFKGRPCDSQRARLG